MLDKLNSILLKCDNDTIFHSVRVSKLAKSFGESLGLTASELNVLQKGALFHDVGKQVVPKTILMKSGKLTEQELSIIRLHPNHGHSLLKPFLGRDNTVLDIILHHHERIDGKGYPDGLKSENIPKLARILAIVDAYDAMTHDRPYRRAMGKDKALAEIEGGLGTQFDPEFGRVFLDMGTDEWRDVV